MAEAQRQGRVVVSADTDFGTILSRTRASLPSVVLFRRTSGRRPEDQAALLLNNLPQVAEALEEGSVVVIEETRVRVRRLPLAG